MSKSPPPPSKTSAPGAGTTPASGEGSWELDLSKGTASFSDWFYERLQWPKEIKRRRLADLRPNLPAGAWEALLLAIRAHLERLAPLDTEISVLLPGGVRARWRVLGSTTERNSRGKPLHLTGSMRQVETERPNAPPGA
jgi:hypothetical protein